MTGVAWLHGYTMDSRVWGPLWHLLPGRRHLGVDLPGHGSAAAEPMSGSLSDWAARVAARLAGSGCRTLVGLSFGSCVALQVALDHPGLLDRLVLAAPTLAGVADDPPARARYLAMSAAYRRGADGHALAQLWMVDPPAIFTGLRRYPEEFARVRAIVAQHPFTELGTGAMAALAAARHDDEALAGLTVPTTVLVGSQDMPRFLENAGRLGRLVPGCEVRVMDGAGHLPLLERPEASARLLGELLDGPTVQPNTQTVSHPA